MDPRDDALHPEIAKLHKVAPVCVRDTVFTLYSRLYNQLCNQLYNQLCNQLCKRL